MKNILNIDDFKLSTIDTGNHSAKILNCHGDYVHTHAFSLELDKVKARDMNLVNDCLRKGQRNSDIVYFVKNSTLETVFEGTGFIIGHDGLMQKDYNKEDSAYVDRYINRTYFHSTRYIEEVIGYIALSLWNFKTKAYDNPAEVVILSLGLPADLAEDVPFVKKLISLLEGKAFTLDTCIGVTSNENNDFNKCCKSIQFYIQKVQMYSQPLGTICSLALTDKGDVNEDYANLLIEKALCVDGGYVTLDTYSMENAKVNLEANQTKREYGMKNIHESLSQVFNSLNPSIDSPVAVRKLIEIEKKNNFHYNGRFTYDIKNDYDRELDKKTISFKERFVASFNNFNDYRYVVFTGGTGAIYFDKIKESFSNKVFLARVPYINDPTLSSIFANVQGYNNLTISKLLNSGKIKSDNFEEIKDYYVVTPTTYENL